MRMKYSFKSFIRIKKNNKMKGIPKINFKQMHFRKLLNYSI